MKELIKQLSEEQKNLKQARKTGTLPAFGLDYFGGIINSTVPENIRKAWSAACKANENKPRITAALNLYHEIRGSSYRHGIPEEYRWQYDRELEKLRAEIAKK